MTKPEFLKKVAAQVDGAKPMDVDNMLEGIIEVLTSDVLKGGDSVNITGLGIFKQKKTEPRTGRNPRTGESVAIGAKTSLVFKMTSALKS